MKRPAQPPPPAWANPRSPALVAQVVADLKRLAEHSPCNLQALHAVLKAIERDRLFEVGEHADLDDLLRETLNQTGMANAKLAMLLCGTAAER